MPPVREASTKPSAATVLPAPVACSNQKRRAAPGSSSSASAAASSSASSAGSQSSGSSSGSSSPSISTSPECSSSEAALPLPFAVAADQELGLERDQRAGEGIDLVGGERRAVREVRLVLREQPLEARASASNSRRHSTEGSLRPCVDLLQRGVERGAARAVLRERGGGVLSFEYERFAREFLGALQVIAGNRRGFGHGASFSHGKAVLGKGKRRAEPLVPESAGYARRAPPLSLSPARATGQVLEGTLGVNLLKHTDDQNGATRPWPRALPSFAACVGSLRYLVLISARRMHSDSGPPPTANFYKGGRGRASRRASRRNAAPGRGEQVGVLVRPVPPRVPVLPGPGEQAQGRGRRSSA